MNIRAAFRNLPCKLGRHHWCSVAFVYGAWIECDRCGKRA